MLNKQHEEELRKQFESMNHLSEELLKRGRFGEYVDDATNKLWFNYRAGAIQMLALVGSSAK